MNTKKFKAVTNVAPAPVASTGLENRYIRFRMKEANQYQEFRKNAQKFLSVLAS